jgi:hypothetical protein
MSTPDILTARRVEVCCKELRHIGFNLARTVALAQHIATEIEADEPGPLNNTGTLIALLETIRLASLHLHGTLGYVVDGSKEGTVQ